MTATSRLRVAVTDATGRRVTRGAAAGLGAWLAGHAPARARGDVAIAIISDSEIRRLNRVHRGKNYVTDVLSFPSDSASFLGDIAIASGRARLQARQAAHDLRTEFRVLALHGLLHLMGYDHEEDRGEMARAEERLRRRAGLPAGLIGRSASRPTRSRRA